MGREVAWMLDLSPFEAAPRLFYSFPQRLSFPANWYTNVQAHMLEIYLFLIVTGHWSLYNNAYSKNWLQ